ncbi:MAG: hypothetical protein EOM78_18980, partial [Erysipelotrichia bacterium]|nr:hypothetical protein [Erysipelotrichia bacterium]
MSKRYLIEKFAQTKDGKIKVGSMIYDYVVILPMETIHSSTLEILKKVENFFVFKNLPARVDARITNIKMSNAKIYNTLSSLKENIKRKYIIKNNNKSEIFAMSRKWGNDQILFIQSQNREEQVKLDIELFKQYK